MTKPGDEGGRDSSKDEARGKSRGAAGGGSSGGGDSGGGGGSRGRRSSVLQGRLSHEGGGASKGSDLAKRLEHTLEGLRGVGQDDEWPEGLQETAEDLSSARVMNHPNRDVRQLVACCLVEVLRIYAPDAPYTSNELLSIFSLIVTELRGLCTAVTPGEPRTDRTFHILDSLSTTKSCLIVVNMVHERIAGGQDLLVELFEVLLTGIRPEHSQDVLALVEELLWACMEELDVIFQTLLDTILIHLLPVARAENPMSYTLAKGMLDQFFGRVHKPISQFVNSILTGTTAGSAAESELAEHVLPLIFELHKVQPRLLLHILPNVAAQLQAEEQEVRSAAIALLGRLFSSHHHDYGPEVPKIWMQFLGRFKDLEPTRLRWKYGEEQLPRCIHIVELTGVEYQLVILFCEEIRSTMVHIGAVILHAKPALREDLHAAIALRLQDPDWEVRTMAVKELLALTDAEPTMMPKTVLESIGERIRDRKPSIRKLACTGLGRAYSKHISSKWLPEEAWSTGGGTGGRAKGRGKAKKHKPGLELFMANTYKYSGRS